MALATALWWVVASQRPWAALRSAEAAARSGDWPEALASWRAVNASPLASGRTLLAEARAALALGRAGEAETVLRLATIADPSDPQPWRLWLEILRVEDRPTDALRVGTRALAEVAPDGRLGVLRALTLALLADLPDDLARETLKRWSAGDGESPDPDALAALYQRMNAMPRGGDPDRAARVAALSNLLAREPGRIPAREALVTALADAGEIDRGRAALDAWPAGDRDARYWRLKGRWELEYDRRPDEASAAFVKTLEELPHDWKTRVRLARALRSLGREAEARREAEAVGRLRERLDPESLGPALSAALENPEPKALTDLADLCEGVGLPRLAEAWRREAQAPREDRFESLLGESRRGG